MSATSFRNAAKSNQKTHRERSQPAARAHLGVLEKKKDYKARAQDFQRKKNTIKALKRKALDKNPDEFYFKMVRTRLEDGVHQVEDKTPKYTEDQHKLMQSQDLRYVQHKRSLELKKIEKLKGGLHLLDASDKPLNKHTIFVESKKEARDFDPVKHFETHPALVNRAYNRTKLVTLKTQAVQGPVDEETLQEIAVEREKKYKELGKRITRERELNIISQKLQTKKNLMDKKSRRKKVQSETTTAPAVYRWLPQRKR